MVNRGSGATSFFLLLLALRIVFLLGALDPSQERVMEVVDAAGETWWHGPERPLYDREELYAGTGAQAIRMRLDLPLDTYRFMPYGSGSLLITLLAVPLYALFGPHYLVFKILPLLICVLGGLFWFRTVDAWLGRRVAWAFGLLYAFAPSVLVHTSLIAKGDHAEAMTVIGAVFFLATRALLTPIPARRIRWAVATGVLAGLGVYLTYSTIPVLAGVGIAAIVLTRVRPYRVWAGFGVGLMVGLVPWFLTLAATSGGALSVYGETLGAAVPLSEVQGRIELLISRGLLAGYVLPGGRAVRMVAGLLWGLAVLAGWIALLRALRRPVAVLVLAATVAALVAFCLRAPDSSSRYLVSGYPLFLIAAAFVTGSGNGARAAGATRGLVVVGVLCFLGLVAQVNSVADARFASLRAPLRGTDWPLLGEVAGQKVSPEVIRRLPSAVRPHFWTGHGKWIFAHVGRADWRRAVGQVGDEATFDVWRGIGIAWFESGIPDGAADMLRALSPRARAGLRQGLAHYGEVILAPVAASVGPGAFKGFLNEFAGEDRGELRTAMARTVATLAVQGVALGDEPRGKPDPFDQHAFLGREALITAIGWALFRDAPRGALRLWKPAPGTRAVAWADSLRNGQGDLAVWRGIAEAYQRELETRTAGWILGGREGPVALAAGLETLTGGLSDSPAALFYEAAGEAAGRALRDPDLLHDRGEASFTWHWEPIIPKRFHEALRRGLLATNSN